MQCRNPAQLGFCHKIKIGFHCQLAEANPIKKATEPRFGQPVNQWQLRVDFDWKPTVRRRQADTLASNPKALAKHPFLIRVTANVLKHGRRMNVVKGICYKRKIKGVCDQKSNAGIDLLQEPRVVDSGGGYPIFLRVKRFKII